MEITASQIESIMIRFYEGGSAMLGAGIYDRVAPGEAGEDKIVIDIHIPSDVDSETEITVTAKSVVDSTKTDTATITVA